MVHEYVFNGLLGEYKISDDPVNWNTQQKELIRDSFYIGVLRKRTEDYTFIGDALGYVAETYERGGTEAEINIKEFRQVDGKDELAIEFEGVSNLSNYKLEYKDNLTPYVTLRFEDSGFHNRIKTRDDQKVNIGATESIEGIELDELSQHDLILHQRQIEEKTFYVLDPDNNEILGTTVPFGAGHNLPMDLDASDGGSFQTPFNLELNTSTGVFLNETTIQRSLNINLDIDYDVFLAGVFAEPLNFQLVLRVYLDNTFMNWTEILLDSGTVNPGEEINHSIVITTALTALIGQSISLSFIPSFGGLHRVTYNNIDFNVNSVDFFDDTQVKCTYRHEALQKLVEIITDTKGTFESSVFGRTDIGYLENGKYSDNVILSGEEIRNFERYSEIDLKTTMQSLKSQFNVGLGIEKRDRNWSVIVEELPYFFSGEVGFTIHEVTNPIKTIWQEGTFSEVKTGYKKAELEIVNGLEEYNNNMSHASFIKSAKKVLDLISRERADGYGLEKVRRKNKLVAATEDLKEDKDIWSIMTINGTSPLRARKNEGFESVENIFSPQSSYNLDLTPQSNLLRNGDWIRGCTQKYPTEDLKFINSEKITDLTTKKTDEPEVIEQSTVKNQDLLDSLWINETYEFDCKLNAQDMDVLEVGSRMLVKWSPHKEEDTTKYFYGWALIIKGGGEDRVGSMKLLRANLNSKRVKLVDPIGIDPEPPSTEEPPENPPSGFSYGFEMIFE